MAEQPKKKLHVVKHGMRFDKFQKAARKEAAKEQDKK